MNKSGMVLNIERNKIILLTNDGQFVKVKANATPPNIGENYIGEEIKTTSFFKQYVTAASILFMILSGSSAYAYYSPVSTAVININPSIQLKANRWDRIISYTALNEDGSKVLQGIKIKNKSLDDGLKVIIEEAKRDNFINESYIQNGKTISISVDSKEGKPLKTSKIEQYTKENNIAIQINANGKEVINNKNIKNVETPNIPLDNTDKQNKDIKNNQNKEPMEVPKKPNENNSQKNKEPNLEVKPSSNNKVNPSPKSEEKNNQHETKYKNKKLKESD